MAVVATAEYFDLESALISILDRALEDIDVIAYPESDTFPGVKRSGLLIVGDAGDTLDDPAGRYTSATLAHSGVYNFNLDLYVKELRGPYGIRSVIRQIRDAVDGQRVASPAFPGFPTRFVYRGSRPVGKNEASKIWNYQITVDANYRVLM